MYDAFCNQISLRESAHHIHGRNSIPVFFNKI